jgi:hypothetical protein
MTIEDTAISALATAHAYLNLHCCVLLWLLQEWNSQYSIYPRGNANVRSTWHLYAQIPYRHLY